MGSSHHGFERRCSPLRRPWGYWRLHPLLPFALQELVDKESKTSFEKLKNAQCRQYQLISERWLAPDFHAPIALPSQVFAGATYDLFQKDMVNCALGLWHIMKKSLKRTRKTFPWLLLGFIGGILFGIMGMRAEESGLVIIEVVSRRYLEHYSKISRLTLLANASPQLLETRFKSCEPENVGPCIQMRMAILVSISLVRNLAFTTRYNALKIQITFTERLYN